MPVSVEVARLRHSGGRAPDFVTVELLFHNHTRRYADSVKAACQLVDKSRTRWTIRTKGRVGVAPNASEPYRLTAELTQTPLEKEHNMPRFGAPVSAECVITGFEYPTYVFD